MGSKKIEGEYSWDKILKIQREIGHFTGELIFSYPSRVERNLAITKASNNDNDLAASHFIIQTLRAEAEDILKKRGYPTDLESLKSVKDYDPMTDAEAGADIQILNARQVLLSTKALGETLKAKPGALIFFETLKLLAASLTASAQPFALRGISSAIGEDKSHTKGKLRGVLLAVEETRRAYPNLAKKRLAAWEHLRRLDKAGTPWTLNDEGTIYRITFKDKDTLVLTTATKKGEEAKTLKKSTFMQKYFISRKPGQSESAGCDENGIPLNPAHYWNKQRTARKRKIK
jgi:hypothetical protein